MVNVAGADKGLCKQVLMHTWEVGGARLRIQGSRLKSRKLYALQEKKGAAENALLLFWEFGLTINQIMQLYFLSVACDLFQVVTNTVFCFGIYLLESTQTLQNERQQPRERWGEAVWQEMSKKDQHGGEEHSADQRG